MNQNSPPRSHVVTGRDGLRGTFTGEPRASGQVTLLLSSGRQVLVPAASLIEQPDGTYTVLLGPSDLPASHPGDAAERPAEKAPDELDPDRGPATAGGNPVVLPVIREALSLGKEKKITGRVLVHVTPHEREETVNLPVTSEQVEIERVPVNRVADGTEGIRQEGDVTIVPVFEEVLVVEKRMMLKEEIRIRRRRVETNQSHTVVLREESVEVVRRGADE